MRMKTCTMLLATASLSLALAACQKNDPETVSDNPVPTADSHEPVTPSPYGTDAQETRSHEEAKEAEKPNDDPDQTP